MANTQLTIGTDPELLFVNNEGTLIKAGDHLPKEGKFGVDGHPYLAELRPDPAIYPRDLVENIRKALKTRADKVKQFRWLAGPWIKDKPMGGHIHFGTPFEDRFTDALNRQLGSVLALVEPEQQAKTRRTVIFYGQKPYGMLGDIRKKTWGFEYRTPSSFIVTPGVSLGILTLAKAIILEELDKGKFAYSSLSRGTREQLKFHDSDFYNCNKRVFKDKIEMLWNMFRNMRYFQENMEGHNLWSAVSYLKNKVIVQEGFDTNKDIKLKWKLETKSGKKTLKPLYLDDELVLPNTPGGNPWGFLDMNL